MSKIGINCFNRTSKILLRSLIEKVKYMFCFCQSHLLYRPIRHVDNRNFSQEAKIVAINDPEVTIEEIAQQLKYDSNYGKLDQNIEVYNMLI